MNVSGILMLLVLCSLVLKMDCFLIDNTTTVPQLTNYGATTIVYLMRQMIDLKSKFENQGIEIQTQANEIQHQALLIQNQTLEIQAQAEKIQRLENENQVIKRLEKEMSQLKLQEQNILQKYDQLTNASYIGDINSHFKTLETSIRYFSLSMNNYEMEILSNNITLQNQIEALENLENSKIQNIENQLSSLIQQNFTERVHDLEYGRIIPGRIRLVNGSTAWMGRVEVSQNGSWATISDYSHFDDDDAKVVCRMLGLPWEWAVAKQKAYFGRGSGAIAYDLKGLECTGQEQSIYECARHNATVSGSTEQEINYFHMNDVGVICVSIRLAGGSSPSNGRVELNLGGIWGTICDDGWDDSEAAVVCKMLGYKGTSKALAGSSSNRGRGVIWMEELACTGSESSIMKCRIDVDYRFRIGYAVCSHMEDARVVCS